MQSDFHHGLYLHAYLPKLQTAGGLCYFLHDHLGYPIPSPALFTPIHDRFVAAADRFAAIHHVPVIHFESGQRKDVFEAVIRESLDLGRPDRVGLLFPRRITKATPLPAYGYRSRVITD
jgi:hypothetical protein